MDLIPPELETGLPPDVVAGIYVGAVASSFCRRIFQFLFCPPPAKRSEAEIISIRTTRVRKRNLRADYL